MSEQVNVSRSEISRLNGEVNSWRNQYNSAIGEVNRLGSTIREMDALEKESTAAISLYRERMEEARRRLESTIQRYRAILGDERVSFESSSLRVLEDLEKLEQTVSEKQREIRRLQGEINRLSNSWWSEVPLNPNGDFSEGERWWDPHPGGTLRNATWGYEIIPGKYGEIWLDNKDIDNWPNAALPQDIYNPKYGNLGGLPIDTWNLRGKRFILEADAMIVEDKVYDPKGWSRAAIVIMTKRVDGKNYDINGKEVSALYTEYDFYRRNYPIPGYWIGKLEYQTDYYGYPADQLPFGMWKPFKIDVSEFIANGFNRLGGWGQEVYDMSRIHAWYLVVENTAARTTTRWRNIKIYQKL